jgi:hypothetical protein
MTQRTPEQIRSSLKDYATSELGLIDSLVAEWKILTEIFVYAIWVFEGIMVSFQNTINETIQAKQPPTLDWWFDIIKNFQYGYELSINEDGILTYDQEDEDAKIIAQALLTESPGTSVPFTIRVAKWLSESDKTLQKLSTDELQNFKDYIKSLHPPGVSYEVFSGEPDKLKYEISVEYDPAYTDIEEKVKEKLDEYRSGVNFTETVYREAMLAKVIESPAIKNAYFTLLEGKEDGGSYSTITHEYTLVAGYFEFESETVTLL